MAIPTAYLTVTGNLPGIMADVQKAAVPPKFTHEFLKQIGHASSKDRPIIAVMKAIGFLTDSGEPTDQYRNYKDAAQGRAVLAEALRDAYADLFTVDPEVYKNSATELQGVFARMSGKSDSVNIKMAGTFKALSDLADFSASPKKTAATGTSTNADVKDESQPSPQPGSGKDSGTIVLRHDVHLHLPISTDIAVYDAIFRSLRENLGD